MPSGAKKRKAVKRKNQMMPINIHQQDSPMNPNPDPIFLSPLPHDRGNENEKNQVLYEGEAEETFQTPRFQPDTPRFAPETPYYSMDNMKNGRRGEIEGLREANVLLGENSKSLDVEIHSKDEESSEEIKLEESGVAGESYNMLHQESPDEVWEDDDVLKDTKLDEPVEQSEDVEDVPSVEKSGPVDEGRTPIVSSDALDVSSSNVNEVEVVPWPDEEIASPDGDVNVNAEKGNDIDGNRMSLQKEEVFKETKLENLGDENKQPIPVTDVVLPVQEMLHQIDMDLTSNKSDKSVENSSASIENSALITEQARRGSVAPYENSESLIGASDASSHGKMKNAAEPSANAEKTEITQRTEVACGSVVAPPPRATLWNCCGLLEVISSSDR